MRRDAQGVVPRTALAVALVALVFGGCAGLRQFPDASQGTDALQELDAEYKEALDRRYATSDPAQQTVIRNRLIEGRMAVIDAHFKTFEAGLVKEHVRTDFGLALIGLAVGAAGSLAVQTASQILSAVSGGLAGTQAAYGKSVLYDKTMAAMLAQMHAGRKTVAAQIFQRWSLDIERYPMSMARTDLDAYYFAGSLPGAILGTAADAATKEAEADAIILRTITAESAAPGMFDRRSSLTGAVEGLTGSQAKALVPRIEAAFPDVKAFFDAQYGSGVRAADADGSKAKALLKRAVVLTVRSAADAETWQTSMQGLP